MVSKATKIRLGVFLVAGAVLVLIFAAAVAGNKLTQKWDSYYIEFIDYPVSGLQVGGIVNYQGIKVGRVAEVKIDPKNVNKVIVKIDIEPGTPIKVDTEAVLSTALLTGIKAVEIKGGTNEAKNMAPGSQIRSGSTLIDDISERAMTIVEQVELIAANIGKLTNDENQRHISKILEQTGLILEGTRSNLAGTLDAISKIANNVADMTTGLSKNIDEISASAVNAIDSLNVTTVSSLELLTKTLNDELVMITRNLNDNIDQISEQTTYLVQDTRFHINTIGENTNALVLDTTKEIAYVSQTINNSLDSINKVIGSDEFGSMMSNLDILAGQLADANLKDMVGNLGVTVQRTGVLINTLNRTVLRSQDDLAEIMENMRDASANLNDFSRQIVDNPAVLIRGN
ncbi:MAG: MlaD family protein [Candidatus Cloacimonetes bacterium]|jgi:phospholipid/cholesterol/gamma-HCH transport system substrate-binding protein|nr:MlaD family protein [Candidatus Cloacimonadota bacterium]MDD2423000.1 MlaD family protein [Candidatus Cloacimonadota bacterium]MDD3563415.1 MlaD family protein [Candidatus Cloacimonadota bacterium]MDD4276305.1 MlaD family protein [Candidatus Cloacimonadota bacterium]MDY0325202.1 MlaD family protein [Candidatus Cloacimonadaceae bacterium]